MKRANKMGSVYKLSDAKRRRPWVAKVTRGFKECGEVNGIHKFKQEYKIIGYYSTQTEALEALNNYLGVTYNRDVLRLTFSNVYTQWINSNMQFSESSKYSYNAAYKALSNLHEFYFDAIKASDIETAIAVANKNYPTIKNIKILLNQLYNYAIGNDIVDKDYSKHVKYDKYKRAYHKKNKRIYKEEEIKVIWDNNTELISKILLILLYTGLRISELLELKTSDVDLDNRFISITTSKTENGKRMVPIPDCIFTIMKSQYNENKTYFLYDGGYKYSYEHIRGLFKDFNKANNMNHILHECRHTYTSRLRVRGVDSTFTKKLTGHSCGNVDEDIYTHVSINDLCTIVNEAFEEDMKYVW